MTGNLTRITNGLGVETRECLRYRKAQNRFGSLSPFSVAYNRRSTVLAKDTVEGCASNSHRPNDLDQQP